MTYTVPSTGLIKFKVLDAVGAISTGGQLNVSVKRSDNSFEYWSNLSLPSSGIASFKFPDGIYRIIGNPRNSNSIGSTYTYTVSGGTGVLKNSSEQVISLIGGYFELVTKVPNLNIKVVSPNDTSTILRNISLDISPIEDLGGADDLYSYAWIETTTSPASFVLLNGNYNLNLQPVDGDFASNSYSITVVGNVPVVKLGTETQTAVGGIYYLPLRKPQIKGVVKAPDGTLVRYSSIAIYKAAESRPMAYSSTDSAGRFSVNLGAGDVNGNYKLQALPQWGRTALAASEFVLATVSAGAGPMNLELTLRTSNVIGVVSGPRGVSPYNNVRPQKLVDGKWIELQGFEKGEGIEADKDGSFGFFLEAGTYRFWANSDMESAGGTAGYSSDCVVGGDASTIVTCNLSLPAPNVSGTLTINGIEPNWVNVGFLPSNAISNNTAKDEYWSDGSSDGYFGATVAAGTYRMWINYRNNKKNNTTIPGPLCTVPVSGNVTCNIDLPSNNFNFKINNYSGTAINNNVYAGIQVKEGDGYLWTCCSYPDSTGKFSTPLLNGSYRIQVMSGSDAVTDGSAQNYVFEVETGTVKNMKKEGTSSTINPTAGIYALQLSAPQLAGILYAPNGMTPVPNVQVSARYSGELKEDKRAYQTYWAYTNESGKFAFNLGNNVLNGEYTIQALAPGGDITKGNSDPLKVTVNSDVGPSNINLRLKTPNFTGTITGPKGAYTKGGIQLLKLSNSGVYEWLDNSWNNTDDLGRFAYSLGIGSYRIYAFADFATTDATATWSDACVISDTATATTCSFSLDIPNTSGSFTIAGVAPNWGNVEFWPASGIANNTARGSYGANAGKTGKFGLNIDAGTYRIYGSDSNGNRILGPLCVVPTTGTVICNVTLPVANAKFKVLSSSGVDISATSYLGINFESEVKANGDRCCSRYNSLTGIFEMSLLDGTYRVSTRSDGSSNSGIGQTYTFDVVSSVVSNLKIAGSSSVLTATGGIYSLSLRAPPLAGNVYKPNGTTPQPNARVLVQNITANGTNTWYAWTDQNGYFAIDLGPDYLNGQYTLQSWNSDSSDTSTAKSIVKTETITAGVGPVNIVLNLRTPNFTGVVSGPTGISTNNYVEIQQQDSFGNWNWKGIGEGRSVNRNGGFALYLSSGTYRVSAQSDIQGTGGGAGFSNNCVVILESATVTTCNVTLPPPNASGTLTFGGTIIQNSNVQLQPDNSVKNNRANSYYYSSVAPNGFWGVTAAEGTYRTRVYSYIQGVNSTVVGPQCVVPASGTVVCNLALPAINLNFKVKDTAGALLTNNVYSNLQIKSGDQWMDGGYISPDNATNSGRFTAPLLNGSYQITVNSNNNGNRGTANVYLFEVESATVKNMRVARSGESITATAGVYELSLKQPAFSGVVLSTDGVTPVADVEVTAQLITTSNMADLKKRGIPFQWSSGTNSAGEFSIDFGGSTADGTYEIQAVARSNTLTLGSSIKESITVTSGIGSNSIRLNLRAPNVSGVVSGIKGVSPSNWIQVRKLIENGNYEYLNAWRSTNSLGQFAFTLDPGSYLFSAQSDMKFAGGTSATSPLCEVPATGSITCDISLPAPNMSGKITVGGVSVSGSIEFLKVTGTGFDYAGLFSGTSDDGVFAITAPAGTYRSRIYIYDKGTFIFGPVCVVPSTGSVICDASLPAANLTIKILNKDSVVMNSGINVYTEALYSNGRLASCCSQIGRDLTNPVIRFGFIDGNYRLSLWPNDNKLGASAYFLVEVESGTVKSLKREGSATSLVAVDGVFSLALTPPVVSGTVVAPDGTTPVPSTEVSAFKDGQSCMWCEYQNQYSDNTGYYGFSMLPDGTYQMVARAPISDSTKGDSVPASVTVTGGVGASNFKLTLQNPTVRGVVRGPNGVSPNNYIYVRQVSSNGSDFWPDYVRNKPSSGDGSFAFALPPGTYQFEAQGDMTSAGGVGARSENCVITDTSTVINCDIVLKSPNLKIQIVKPDGTNFADKYSTYGYLWFAGKYEKAKNYSPQLSFDSLGNYATNLEDGTWGITVLPNGQVAMYSSKQYRIIVSNGSVTSVTSWNDETVTVISGVYQLPLTGTNLIGTITFAGENYKNGANVGLQRKVGDRYEWRDWRWSYGEFGFKVDPGTYRLFVQPYGSPTIVASTYSNDCVVADSGSTTCNVALQAPNLKGNIKTPSGDTYRFAYAYLYTKTIQNNGESTYIRVENAQFGAYLETSTTYSLEIYPYWDQRNNYSQRSYEIVVGSSSITSVRDVTGSETLTAIDGFYTFKVSSSSLKGTVLPPGSGTIGVGNVQIEVALPGSSSQWIYSTSTDQDGKFGLLVPDGTYVIRAIPYNNQFQYGKSETQTVVISGGTTSAPITLRLREPNLTGRVVTPGVDPKPLANVNVNVRIAGEYFYGWTDSSGQFGFFVDNAAPNCSSACRIDLNYYKSSEFTPKSYSISAVTNLGDLQIGGVTSKINIRVPQIGSATTANRYGWVSVESVDSATSYTTYVTGGQTDELGKVGLSLTDGVRYKITAYLGYEFNGKFEPKIYEISSYSAATMGEFDITFDRPNLYISAFGSTGVANSFGWTRVSKLESGTATYNFYSNIYLDERGEAAYTLSDGTYKIVINPGKTIGTQRTAVIEVLGGVASCSSGCANFVTNRASINLPNGNISGTVRDSAGTLLKGALIIAIRTDDAAKNITAVTSPTGVFEINLDTNFSWNVGVVDPGSGEKASFAITATPGTSNTIVADRNVTLVATT